MNAPRNGAARGINAGQRNNGLTSLELYLNQTPRAQITNRARMVSALDLDGAMRSAMERGDYTLAIALEDRQREVRAWLWGGGQ